MIKIKSDINFFVGTIILIISIIIIISALNLKGESAYFPFGLSVLLGFLSIILMVSSLKIKRKKEKLDFNEDSNVTKEDNPFSGKPFKKAIIAGTMSTIYVILIYYIGLIVSTILFIPSFLLFMQIKGYLKYIIITLSFVFFIYLVFTVILNVFLPTGVLFD